LVDNGVAARVIDLRGGSDAPGGARRDAAGGELSLPCSEPRPSTVMERSAGVPGPQALEAKVAEARPTFEEFFGTEHARLFGALCFVTGDRDEAEEIMQDDVEPVRPPVPVARRGTRRTAGEGPC
jgi:hypothetical protein